jgi:hypothetical protein
MADTHPKLKAAVDQIATAQQVYKWFTTSKKFGLKPAIVIPDDATPEQIALLQSYVDMHIMDQLFDEVKVAWLETKIWGATTGSLMCEACGRNIYISPPEEGEEVEKYIDEIVEFWEGCKCGHDPLDDECECYACEILAGEGVHLNSGKRIT